MGICCSLLSVEYRTKKRHGVAKALEAGTGRVYAGAGGFLLHVTFRHGVSLGRAELPPVPEDPREAAEIEALADRLLRPERDRLDEARAIAAGREARDAWRALSDRGLVPPSWVDDPRRSFRSLGGASHRGPPSASCAASFASIAAAMARAEELGRAIAEALAPWGGDRPDAIAWRLLPRGRRVRQRALRSDAHPSLAMLCAANAAENLGPRPIDPWATIAVRLSQRRGRSAEARIFERDVADAMAWRRASGGRVVVSAWPVPQIFDHRRSAYIALAIPASTYGRRFDELPDPFTPLLAIWRLGFALDRIGGDAIVLIAPEAGE